MAAFLKGKLKADDSGAIEYVSLSESLVRFCGTCADPGKRKRQSGGGGSIPAMTPANDASKLVL